MVVREPGSPPKLSNRIGYYIPDSARSLEVESGAGGGDKVKYFPYRELEPSFRAMLGNVFSSVAKIGDGADAKAMAEDNIGYIISPKVVTSSSSTSGVRWPPTNFTFELTCDVRTVDGKTIASPRVVGLGQYVIPTIIAGADLGAPGKRAMLDALGQMQKLLLEMNYSRPTSSPSQPSTGPNANNEAQPRASGTGAIVSSSGHVLTAAHVVAGATRISVVCDQGIKSATIVRFDETNDLAVLKLASGAYDAMPISPSRRVRLGQSVATIGFPHIDLQGFSPKVTRGEISSLNGFGDDPRSWQVSVPVQSGNSGGALIDDSGNLVGVIVSKLGLNATRVTGDITQNVNYAVKSAYALALLEPYLDSNTPVPFQLTNKPSFEDMVAKALKSVVLILVY